MEGPDENYSYFSQNTSKRLKLKKGVKDTYSNKNLSEPQD